MPDQQEKVSKSVKLIEENPEISLLEIKGIRLVLFPFPFLKRPPSVILSQFLYMHYYININMPLSLRENFYFWDNGQNVSREEQTKSRAFLKIYQKYVLWSKSHDRYLQKERCFRETGIFDELANYLKKDNSIKNTKNHSPQDSRKI